MRCPQCGAVYSAEYNFCVKCGAVLVDEGLDSTSVAVPQPRESRRHRWRRLASIAAVLLMAVALLAGAVWWISRRAPTSTAQIAYLVSSDEQTSLWLATIEQTATIKLFDGVDEIRYLTQAGEGRATPFLRGNRVLLFVARAGDTFSLYWLDVEGDDPVLLAEDVGEVEQGAFSANGRTVLLSTRDAEGQASVLMLDGLGKESPRVVARGQAVGFSLSPRGDLFVIRVSRAGQTHLDLVDRQGRTVAVLATGDAGAWAEFSPDGSRLLSWTAGVTEPVGNLAIAPVSEPEQKTHLLAANAESGGFLDGGRLVWVDAVDAHGHSLLLVDLRGGRTVQVTAGAHEQRVYPTRGSVLYVALTAGKASDLYVLEARGERLRFCARNVVADSVVLSPDGRSVAVAEARDELWSFNLLNDQLLRLPSAQAGARPDFSRNGQWLAFQGLSGGEGVLWLLHTDGSERRLIARGGYAPVWSR